MGAVPRSALQLTAEEMREAGYRTVDMLVRHLTHDKAPPIGRATVGSMQRLLGQSAPEEPTPFADVLAGLEGDVLPYRARGDHPGFFAFISTADVAELARETPVLGEHLRAIARSRLHRE